MHGIYQCKHGIVTKRCRCPNDSIHLVSCPPNCKESRIEKLEHDTAYGNPFCNNCNSKDVEIMGLLRQIVALEEKLKKFDRVAVYPKDFV